MAETKRSQMLGYSLTSSSKEVIPAHSEDCPTECFHETLADLDQIAKMTLHLTVEDGGGNPDKASIKAESMEVQVVKSKKGNEWINDEHKSTFHSLSNFAQNPDDLIPKV